MLEKTIKLQKDPEGSGRFEAYGYARVYSNYENLPEEESDTEEEKIGKCILKDWDFSHFKTVIVPIRAISPFIGSKFIARRR